MNEEAEPRALSQPLRADQVHPVIPVTAAHQRQSVAAHRQALVDRANAMLEQRSFLGRDDRLSEGALLSRLERRRAEKRNPLVEHRRVARRRHVLRDHEREPQQIIGAARPQPAAARFMPPVLDVTLLKLPASGAEDMCACQVGSRRRQRHDVLELVAEAEGAARLVVAAACPEPTRDILIDQPAVDEHIEGIVRSVDLDRAERPVPVGFDSRQRGPSSLHRAMPRDQFAGVLFVAALAEHQYDVVCGAGLELDFDVQRRARIQSRTEVRRQALRPQAGRIRQCAVAPDEPSAIAARGSKRIAQMRERDAAAKFGVVRIGGEDAAGHVVQARHDVDALVLVWRAEDPVVVAHEAEASLAPARVDNGQARKLHRIHGVDEDREIVRQATMDARESRHACGVTDHAAAARCRTRHRAWRRRPELPRLVIANKPRLGGRIDHGVVGE